MRRRLAILLSVLMGLGILSGVRDVAFGHTCTTDEETQEEVCEDSPVQDNWRDQYVPLFGLEDRDDESQRYDAQRWRDECRRGDPSDPDTEFQQQCAWAYGGTSVTPQGDEGLPRPNEFHAGFAATHCFLGEFAHQCDGGGHDPGDGVHDGHGGAIYVDACLVENAESKYCDDGLEDTQAGVTIMDHNGCGIFVPIAACTDEYHVVRPADSAYTAAQMENSAEETQLIADDPARYICGFHGSGNSCRSAVNSFLNAVGSILP